MTDYDSITASTEKIQYSANVGLYPESDTISILGPVWLPRVYKILKGTAFHPEGIPVGDFRGLFTTEKFQ